MKIIKQDRQKCEEKKSMVEKMEANQRSWVGRDKWRQLQSIPVRRGSGQKTNSKLGLVMGNWGRGLQGFEAERGSDGVGIVCRGHAWNWEGQRYTEGL